MNYLKTALLLVILTVLLVGMGSLIGGRQGAMTAFVLSLVINGISYWFSDKIVLAMYRAKEAPQDKFSSLYKIVKELSKNAKIPMPRVFVVESPGANAFATGRDPSHACVCVTSGITELLDENELRGVIAHELAHVKNRDTLIMTVTASIAGAIMMIANMIRWGAMFGSSRDDRDSGGNVFGLIAVSIIAPIAALLVQMAISRSREFGADKRGAIIAHDTHGLAMALEKLEAATRYHGLDASPQTAHLFIVNPFKGSFIANLFSTHPPIKERIKKLRALNV